MSELIFNTLKSYDGKVSEREFNSLVDALQSVALSNGLGYSIKRTPLGTTIVTKATSAPAATVCPFDVTISEIDPASPSDTSKKINVAAGSMNNLIPDNNFADFDFTVSDLIYVIATGTSDGKKITSVTLNVGTTAPTPQVPTASSLPTSVDILIAVVVAAKPYRVIPCGSITLNGAEQFITDTSSPAEPGQLPYIPYYVWSM